MGLINTIDREFLKKYIGDEAIFKYYFGDFVLGKAYSSVFRKDEKCSTGFYISPNGSLLYNDLATGEKYDCIKFVAKLKDVSYYNALKIITEDFKISNNNKLKRKAAEYIKPIAKKDKPIFKVQTRPFNKKDLDYWAKYSITKEELILNNVYSVSSVMVNKKTIHTDYEELKFAYLFKDDNGEGYFKIYSPHSEMFKWFSNAPLNLPFGISSLPIKSDTLIITKSVKDCLVLRKFFPDCIGLQNESKASIKKNTLLALQKMYKNIIIFFDADNPGQAAAEYFVKEYNCKSVTTPPMAYIKHKVKDPSDFVMHFGLNNFEEYLKYIKLL